MSEGRKPSKILRFTGILLMGLTAVVLLLAGIGTTCVALGAEKYPSMTGLVEYKWLYQIFVVLTVLVGIVAIRATVNLVRGKQGAFRQALIALVAGLLITGVHMLVSQLLRGSSAPVNFIFYINAFTLLVFLIFRIPGIWERAGFNGTPDRMDRNTTAGASLIKAGILTLTVHLWAGNTHTWGGVNYAAAWHLQLSIIGWLLVISGAAFAWRALLQDKHTTSETNQALREPGF